MRFQKNKKLYLISFIAFLFLSSNFIFSSELKLNHSKGNFIKVSGLAQKYKDQNDPNNEIYEDYFKCVEYFNDADYVDRYVAVQQFDPADAPRYFTEVQDGTEFLFKIKPQAVTIGQPSQKPFWEKCLESQLESGRLSVPMGEIITRSDGIDFEFGWSEDKQEIIRYQDDKRYGVTSEVVAVRCPVKIAPDVSDDEYRKLSKKYELVCIDW